MASAVDIVDYAALRDDQRARLLDNAAERTKEAREAELALMRRLYPVGAHIRWKLGQYIQSGFVQQHSRYEASLWATNENTHKRVRVTLYSIREALRD